MNGLYIVFKVAESDYAISAEQVLHLFHRTLDGLIGISQIQFGADAIGQAISAERAASNYWKNGVRASGFIKTNTWLTEKQRETYRQSVMGFIGQGTGVTTDKQGGVMIIENTADFARRSGVTPGEGAGLLEQQGYHIQVQADRLRLSRIKLQ